MKKILVNTLLCLCSTVAVAQQWRDPSAGGDGKANPRPEFISYLTRPAAESGDRTQSPHYVPLTEWIAMGFTTDSDAPGFESSDFLPHDWPKVLIPNLRRDEKADPLQGFVQPALPAVAPLARYCSGFEAPYLWLDRDVFLHIEGVGGAYTVYVNGKRIGFNNDSRTPTEFPISQAVTDGFNSVGVEVVGYSTGNWMETLLPPMKPTTLGKVYVYSQPKLRIEDFVVRTQGDTTGIHGWVDFCVVMSNSYRSAEKVTLGYDIYSPAGKLLTYNMIERNIPGMGTDTIHRREVLENVLKTMSWSPDKPQLFKLMLYTKRDGRITEYVPMTFGLNHTELRDGQLWINNRKAVLSTADFNALADQVATEKELRSLKARKINTVCVGYPQPAWFYDLCNRVGMYVIDQANINAGFRKDDRNVGGSVANNPAFLPQFIDRAASMQGRSKNYTCVIALSMGGECGNGYNLYKTYQWLKSVDSLHYITYRDQQGEWNADFPYPKQGVSAPSPATKQPIKKSSKR